MQIAGQIYIGGGLETELIHSEMMRKKGQYFCFILSRSEARDTSSNLYWSSYVRNVSFIKIDEII